MNKAKKINKPINKGVAKVPVIMQLEALECGAACLTMILAYYSKWIPLEQVRKDCGVSRDGSSAANVLKAARNYGMSANGYRMEPDALKKQGIFPCIVHWEFNHFIVVDGFRNGKVYINDPARGSVAISEERFDEGFTGVCLLMEPGEDFEPSGRQKSVLEFARKRLHGTGSAVAFVVLTTIITSLMGVIQPGFSKIFMDRLLTGQDPEWVVPFLTGLGILSLVEIAVAWLNAVYALRIRGKLSVVGSSSYMWKVLRLPQEFFSQRMAGDIQQRQNSNATVATTLVDTFAPLVLRTLMMVFYLVVLIRHSIVLTIIGLISVLLNSMIARLVSAKRVNLTRVLMRDSGKLYGTTVAGIEMIESIKASGAENGFFEKWSGYQASVNTGNVRYSRLNEYLGIIPIVIDTLTNSLISFIGVYLTIQGQFTIGSLMAFQGYLALFLGPVSDIVSASQNLQEMRTEMERIEDVMEYPDDTELVEGENTSDDVVNYTKLSGAVELRNVTFGYSKLADPLIKDFSMKLEPGSRVAFVGTSGCGKSTLAKLISGLYQPWSGEILFDGVKRSEISRDVLTGSIAVVDQDIILFEDTIGANIQMWDNSIEDFEVIMAARDAKLHSDIMEREGGYAYKIKDGGRDFSGGQRQRMEIARVLAQDPTIIILDEATSALDAQTEYDVVKAIRDRGITCIVVAHRLSTIRDCDEIIVMKNGEVVERGTHDELFANGGYYTELITSD